MNNSKLIQKDNLLLILTISSVVIGLSLGFTLRKQNLSSEVLQLINFPGEVFLQVLKLMVLPLIFSSLISSLALLDAKASSQMGLITILYYTTTTTIATILGIVLVTLIQPGNSIQSDRNTIIPKESSVNPLDTFLDVIRNIFPENIIQATFQRQQTNYYENLLGLNNLTDPLIIKKVEYVDGMNILGIIMFSSAFGIVLSRFGEKAKNIIDFFIVLEAVIMKLVDGFMWLAPVGIVSLISGNILELENLSETAKTLFMYVVTILTGLAIHTLLVMPVLYFTLTNKNPFNIVKGVFQALVTTFGTASSGAALPVTMQCMEDNIKVDRRVTRFVLPLGATINMDGNALYEAIAVIFIAQLNNVSLGMSQVFTISLIATSASLGLNSVPAGLISILIILKTVGLPANSVPLLITVDWLIDRVRTTMTVLGDCYASGVVEHYLQDKLRQVDENELNQELNHEIELLKVASRKNSTDYRNRRHSTGTMLGPSGKMYLKIINDTDTGINFV